MAKKINYAELSNEDLKSRVVSLQSEISSAAQKLRMGQFKKTSDFPRLRKDIARALTLLRARELGLDKAEKTTEKPAAKKPSAKKVVKKKAAVKKKK